MIGEREPLEKQRPGKNERFSTLANVIGSKQLHRTDVILYCSYGEYDRRWLPSRDT